MDTRAKIAAALPPSALVVSGPFDPLLRQHAEALAALRAGASAPALAVVITDPPRPLLPAHARAALVAALACVDAVFLAGANAPAATVHLDEEHLRLRYAFLQHVRARQS
jgi:bifunctional ADP-heptose synthase (sugar kinase/adenylyltransferase)